MNNTTDITVFNDEQIIHRYEYIKLDRMFDEAFNKARVSIALSMRMSVDDISNELVGDVVVSDDSYYADRFYNDVGSARDECKVSSKRKLDMKFLGKRLHSENNDLWKEMCRRRMSYFNLKVLVAMLGEKRYFEVKYDDVVSYVRDVLINEKIKEVS